MCGRSIFNRALLKVARVLNIHESKALLNYCSNNIYLALALSSYCGNITIFSVEQRNHCIFSTLISEDTNKSVIIFYLRRKLVFYP